MDSSAEPIASAPPPPAAPRGKTPPPDWPAIERDIRCPLCKYNLRGLMEPRCPECGYRFDWDELLHPERLLQEYLFESRPEHNGRAFFHTLWKSLRPATFWSTISPGQRPNARRLVLYWVFACLPLLLGVATNLAWSYGDQFDLIYTLRRLVIDSINGYQSAYLAEGILFALVALALWPWLTFLALNVFIESMLRTRINAIHVLRCLMYTAGVTFLIGVIATIVGAGLLVFDPSSPPLDVFGVNALGAIAAILWAWLTWRLIVAYRLYLRFDRPVATVLASQVVVLLAMGTVVMWAAFYGGA